MPRGKIVKMPIVETKAARKKYTVPVKLPAVRTNKLPQTNKEMKIRPKREPDIIVAVLQNMIAEFGTSRDAHITLACKACICYTTIRNIIEGKTSRPYHSTAKSLIEACGYDYLITKKGIAPSPSA